MRGFEVSEGKGLICAFIEVHLTVVRESTPHMIVDV